MNYVRNGEGKFARGRKWAKRMFAFVLGGLIALIVVFHFPLMALLDSAMHGNVVSAAYEVTPSMIKGAVDAQLDRKLERLKDAVVADIEQCESGGDNGIIVFDSNNEASIGSMQWQRKSVMHYVQKFEGKVITKAEAIAIAIDKDAARELAKRVIFGEKNGWQNWLICGQEVNAGVRIAAIISLGN